jgi:uncharacterized membrane protein YfcA
MKKPKKRSVTLRKLTTRKEETGRLLLDLGKLGFAGIVVGGILRMDLQQDILFIIGVAVIFALFVIGIILAAKEIKPEKTGFRRRKRHSYGKGGRK